MAETTISRRERRRQRAAAEIARQQPRPRPSRASVVESLTAAAVNVRVVQSFTNVRWGATDVQQEGWLHYRTCPEFRQGVNVGANSLSRAKLIGVEIDPMTGELGTQPTNNQDVRELMAEVLGGPASQGQGLASMKRHVDVAGDMWLFITDSPDRDGTSWEVLSTGDVKASPSGKVTVANLDGTEREVDTDTELLIRCWRPDPEHRWQADSPTVALLPVLREIAALSAMVSSTVKSRLASAGILWIPEEISLPRADTGSIVENTQVRADAAGAANAWLDLITEAMTAPIKDPDSASAVVPMVATVKGDLIDKINHMEFGRDLDATIQPLREADVRRLAVGMNAPPEILTGLGDVNHWTGWLITEDFARAYLAPDLELFCDTLTRYYLRPALRARGIDAGRYAVHFDLDALVPKQIRTEDATAAFTAGLLSEVEYMAALGFSASQIASPAERGRRLLVAAIEQGNPDAITAAAAAITQLFPGSQQVNVPTPMLTSGEPAVSDTPPPAQSAVERVKAAAPTATGTAPSQTTPPTR